MMAHTPGPWVTADKRFANGIRTEVEAESGIICSCIRTVNSRMLRTWDEVDANATLIAAAPDLLAALKRLLSLMPVQVWNEMAVHAAGGPDEVNQAADMAAAAINKAEGRD